MKPCAQCGANNPDGAKFCRACGTPFAPAPSVQQPDEQASPVEPPAQQSPAQPNPIDSSAQSYSPVPANPTEQVAQNHPYSQPDPVGPVAQSPSVPPVQPAPQQPQFNQQYSQAGQPFAAPAGQQYGQPINPASGQQYGQPSGQYGQSYVPPTAQPNVAPQTQPQPAQFASQSGQPGQPQYQPQGEVKPLITPEMKAEARAFGDWFKTFFLRPSEVGGGKPWYALAVIFVTTLFSALAATAEIAHGGSSLLGMIPFVDSYYFSRAVNEAAPFVLVVLWVMFTLYLYGILLVLRLMRALMGDPVTFRTLHDDYAHRLAPWLGLFALAAVFALIHVDVLAIALWVLAVVTQSMWMMVLVYEGDSRRSLDSQWVKFLCVLLQIVLSAIVFVILVTALSAIVGAIIAGAMHNVLY